MVVVASCLVVDVVVAGDAVVVVPQRPHELLREQQRGETEACLLVEDFVAFC